jgi:hypothetical protein
VIPNYKVEIWQGGALLYTIVDHAIIRIHDVLTDAVGTFELTLPSMVGTSYLYTDINPFDTVKIWIAEGSLPTDPLFVGRIYRISATTDAPSGLARVFSGKSQGEILERRLKGRTVWIDTDASTIVTELANDLSLGIGEIETDTTHVTLTVDKETYIDVLKKISDYWYNAGNQIKKDFYVNVDNALVWKTRPFRTSGVETLTVGENIKSYTYTRDSSAIKNDIWVYGQKQPFNALDPAVIGRSYPDDLDAWTYGVGWTGVGGTTVASDNTSPKRGLTCTRGTNGSGLIAYYRTFTKSWVEGLDGFGTVEYWHRRGNYGAPVHVRLFCPDSSNYYEATVTDPGSAGVWAFVRLALGNNNVYDATSNPDGKWTATGSPTWEDIEGIYFDYGGGSGYYYDVDGLNFNYARFRDIASDATSETNYGLRGFVITDDDLHTDTQCEHRAESLLYQKKDPINRLDVVTNGNANILLGDRLTISLPAENVSSKYFYPIIVEQNLNNNNWMTTTTMVDTLNMRTPPPMTDKEWLRQELNKRRFFEGPVLSKSP